jgi:hypothetical protein
VPGNEQADIRAAKSARKTAETPIRRFMLAS